MAHFLPCQETCIYDYDCMRKCHSNSFSLYMYDLQPGPNFTFPPVHLLSCLSMGPDFFVWLYIYILFSEKTHMMTVFQCVYYW